MKLCWLWFALSLVISTRSAVADDDRDIILVYDRAIGEVACWYQGSIQTDADCSKGDVHPAWDGLYVYENQRVYVQIIHSMYVDDYAVEVKSEAQPEPSEHVFGALTEVPKISLFDSSVKVVPGAPGVLVSGEDPVKAMVKKLPELTDAQLKDAIASRHGAMARTSKASSKR